MRVFFTVLSTFFISVLAQAQYLTPTHFFGYEWGTPYKAVLKKTKESKVKFKAEKNFEIVYKEADENVKLVFDHGLFQAIKSRTFSTGERDKAIDYMNGQLEILVSKYGDYESKRFHPEELTIFEWKFEETNLSLMYYYPTNTVSVEYTKN